MSYISGTKVLTALNTEEVLGTVQGRASYKAYVDTSNMETGDVLEIRGYMTVIPGGTKKRFALGLITDLERTQVQYITPVLVEKGMEYEVRIVQTSGTPKAFDWRISNISSPF